MVLLLGKEVALGDCVRDTYLNPDAAVKLRSRGLRRDAPLRQQ